MPEPATHDDIPIPDHRPPHHDVARGPVQATVLLALLAVLVAGVAFVGWTAVNVPEAVQSVPSPHAPPEAGP